MAVTDVFSFDAADPGSLFLREPPNHPFPRSIISAPNYVERPSKLPAVNKLKTPTIGGRFIALSKDHGLENQSAGCHGA